MTTNYMQVDTEVLGQMMRVAKQNSGLPQEQLEALSRAVEERKQQLSDQLADLIQQSCGGREAIRLNEGSQLKLYQQLITLEPDHYAYYEQAGKCAQFLDDYPTSVAYYTSALQLVGDDVEKLGELYQERSRSYLRHKDYANALADGKLFLRFSYLSQQDDGAITRQKAYNLYMICESLRQLGQKALGDEIETTYELAELSDEGVTDELIQDYCRLLDIPFEARISQTSSRPPFSRLNELKQQVPTEPSELKKWNLRQQMYEEIEIKPTPDFALLMRVSQELVTLDPENYRYHATAGEMSFRASKYAEAIPHFTNAIKLTDHYGGDAYWQRRTRREHLFTLHRMAAYAYVQERYDQNAIAHYEQAIRAYPQHPETTNLLAMIIHRTYRWSSSYKYLLQRANSMEQYFDQVFPQENVPWYVAREKAWEESFRVMSTQFIYLNRLGIVRRLRQPTDPQTEVVASPVLSPAKSEQERQQEQKAAETIKHLEVLLRLLRPR